MTSDELEDKYPHWKDALFGNHNAVANLRCAVHYVFWHAAYSLIAIIGLAIMGLVKVAKTIARPLGPLREPAEKRIDAFVKKANYVANHETTENVAMGALLLLMAGIFLYWVGIIIWFLYQHFWQAIAAIGAGIGIVAVVVVIVVLGDRYAPTILDYLGLAANATASKARAAGEKATKTPGVRRVYGECPVSMDMAPKWFNDIFPEEEY